MSILSPGESSIPVDARLSLTNLYRLGKLTERIAEWTAECNLLIDDIMKREVDRVKGLDSAPPATAEYPKLSADSLVTIDDVIKQLGVTRTTLYYMRLRPGFPAAVHISRRALRFRQTEIDEWIEKGGNCSGEKRR